jgi:hypothetical protein
MPVLSDTAGISEWIIYEDQFVGVDYIDWNDRLGIFRAGDGKIYASIYIVVYNQGNTTETYSRNDFSLVDGNGKVNTRDLFAKRQPDFKSCTAQPGQTCQGWWTTEIVDTPESREFLTLVWSPCVFACGPFRTQIDESLMTEPAP